MVRNVCTVYHHHYTAPIINFDRKISIINIKVFITFNILFLKSILCKTFSCTQQLDNNDGNLLIYSIYFEVYRNVKFSNPIYSPMCVSKELSKQTNKWTNARSYVCCNFAWQTMSIFAKPQGLSLFGAPAIIECVCVRVFLCLECLDL